METIVWVNGTKYQFHLESELTVAQLLEKTRFRLKGQPRIFDGEGIPRDPQLPLNEIPDRNRQEIFVFSKAAGLQAESKKKDEFAVLSALTEILFPLFIHGIHDRVAESRGRIFDLVLQREEEFARLLKRLARLQKLDQQTYIIKRQSLYESIKDHFALYEAPAEVWTDDAVNALFDLIDRAFGIDGEKPRLSA